MLTDIREGFAAHLRSQTYFSADPAITIFTEKLNTLENDLKNALSKWGLTVLVTSVIARKGKNQIPNALYFDEIAVIAHAQESPRLNKTGISCSDLAEAIAWYGKGFAPLGLNGGEMLFRDIVIGDHKSLLVYNVIFSLEGQIAIPPVRPTLS